MLRGARYVVALVGLIAATLLAGPAGAQGPVGPQHNDPTWQASYWNNTSLAGSPVLQRAEANLDYNWGTGSPDGILPADNFSARWSRYIDTAGGVYRFTARSDDGIRVSVDGNLIINDWSVHAARSYTADVALSAEHHLVVVEYFDGGGEAVVQLSWAPAGQTVQNWRGEYFNNTSLIGSPALVRDDANLDFSWETGAPGPGVNADNFSVRWTRTLDLAAGTYRFSATVDDGVRLWVNNHLLIDLWQEQAERTLTGDIYLPGGATSVRMEYFDMGGRAVAQLRWTGSGDAPAGGEVIVDDTSAGFSKGGSTTGWRTENEGHGGRLTWTRNNDWTRPNYNWARWYPSLAARSYEVFVYIPERFTTTSSASYWVSHAGGYTRRVVNQSANGSRWVSLGTYRFRGTNADYVSLTDVTGEQYLSRLIGFDAMKWVPR